MGKRFSCHKKVQQKTTLILWDIENYHIPPKLLSEFVSSIYKKFGRPCKIVGVGDISCTNNITKQMIHSLSITIDFIPTVRKVKETADKHIISTALQYKDGPVVIVSGDTDFIKDVNGLYHRNKDFHMIWCKDTKPKFPIMAPVYNISEFVTKIHKKKAPPKMVNDRKYCEHCSRDFFSLYSLRQHVLSKHPDKAKVTASGKVIEEKSGVIDKKVDKKTDKETDKDVSSVVPDETIKEVDKDVAPVVPNKIIKEVDNKLRFSNLHLVLIPDIGYLV